MEEIEDKIVNATRNQIEGIKESVFWKDVERETALWKKGFDIELRSIVNDASESNPSTASILLHMGEINGRIKAVDYLLSLPDIFLQILEDQKNDSERNRTD